jgi:hypothetical protein
LGGLKRIHAFDNLYNSLSTIRIEQERMFPLVANFQGEAVKIIDRLNISLKDAFEETADVNIKLHQQIPNQYLIKWLSIRSKYYQNCFADGDPDDLNEIRDYFLAIIDFENRDRSPLDLIMNEKEFFYYHKKIHKAIGNIDELIKLVKNTKAYRKIISEKFEFTAKQLEFHYGSLFNRELIADAHS